jgi:hypothetical protein
MGSADGKVSWNRSLKLRFQVISSAFNDTNIACSWEPRLDHTGEEFLPSAQKLS